MVKWEPALNAHILAVALAVSEVTATKEMAEAALAAWCKYHFSYLFLSFTSSHSNSLPSHLFGHRTFPYSFVHFYRTPIPTSYHGKHC